MRNGNCVNLLSKSHESFYWLGFLFADAHFSNSNRLNIAIHNKDIDHLIKLSNFLGGVKVSKVKNHDHSKISIMHSDVIKNLCEEYSISSNKTEFPVNLSKLSLVELFCIFVGFIDGDGSIGFQYKRKDIIIRIQCHSSWIENLKLMYPQAKIKINKQGYSLMTISNSSHIKEIKRRAIELNLPILSRKWDKIDLDFVSKYEKAKINHEKIEKLLEEGKSILDISKILSIKYTTIYMSIKRKKQCYENSIK